MTMMLVRRGAGPSDWRWDIPAGPVQAGETPEQAARRVVAQQIGLEVGQLARVFAGERLPGEEGTPSFLFEAATFGGEPAPGPRVVAWRWTAPGELMEDLISGSMRSLLHRWLRARWGYGITPLGSSTIFPKPVDLVAEIGPPWPSAGLPAGMTVEAGTWRIEEGALSGSIEGRAPADIWFDAGVEGDQLLVFSAYAVPPYHNDINAYWEGSGHILGLGDVACTIGGLGGWYRQLTGIERYPNSELRSVTGTVPVEPGRVYCVVAGRKGAIDFLYVDGVLIVQLTDTAARRRAVSHIALATWDGHVRFLRAAIYRIP
jgi:ADP-ribose pyrophosphatase YjhB (NUDIX family)